MSFVCVLCVEAIRQSNHMLRERYQEFVQFHASKMEEKEFIMSKFQEARLVVENLHMERMGLETQLQQAFQDLERLKVQLGAVGDTEGLRVWGLPLVPLSFVPV